MRAFFPSLGDQKVHFSDTRTYLYVTLISFRGGGRVIEAYVDTAAVSK